MHPLAAINEWLDSLRPDHRTTVMMMVLVHMPDVRPIREGYQTTEDNVEVMRNWLAPDQTEAFRVTGKAAMFRVLVDLAMRNFFTEEGRQFTRAKQERFRHHLLVKGDQDFADKVGKSQEERDLHDAHWARAASNWKKLCETDISDAALNAYMDANPPSLFR